MDSGTAKALFAFLALVLLISACMGCQNRTRPELVLAARPSQSPSPAPVSTASPAPNPSTPAKKDKKQKAGDAWFVVAPVEGNTAFSGSFATSLPEGTKVRAKLRIAPLGGAVTLTDTLTVHDYFLHYDFSDRLPRSAIDRQYATLTLCLYFSDPQPKKLLSAFGETGEKLAEGFVTGKVMAARVEMVFALPFPDGETVADLETPVYENPSDLVFATSQRYHDLFCRYAASAEPCARAFAELEGLKPCAICCP